MKKPRKCLSLIFTILICLSVKAQTVWTIKACIDTAYKLNLSINQGVLSKDINKINLIQSKASLAPNINLTDGQNFSSGYSLDPYTYQYTNKNISINNLALNSSVTLFNGYLLLHTVRQNKLLYDASMLDIEKNKNDIMLNIIAGYMQVLMDYEAIEVAFNQVKISSTLLDQTRHFVEFGKAPEINLLQLQSQLASDQLAEVNAKNQTQLDKVILQQLINIPVSDNFEIDRNQLMNIFPQKTASTEEIVKISEFFLPQVKSATLKTSAALYSLKISKSSLFPKLTMTGYLKTGYSSLRSNITQSTYYNSETIGYVNNSPSQPVIGIIPVTILNRQIQPLSEQLKSNFSQAISFNLAIPIFNNLQSSSNVSIARINLMKAKLNEKQIINDLRKSIETSYLNQISAEKKMNATEEQMILERKTYNNMEIKFSAGAINTTDFLIEKNNYNKVSMSLIQAKYDYILKTKMVDFYLGKPLIY